MPMPNSLASIHRILKRIVIDPSGCHLWTGATTRGYGHATYGGYLQYVHRIIWEYRNGPIPEGLQIDHICRVRACCNPEHLRVVTGKVNTLAGNNMAARHARKLVCPNCAGPYTTFQRKRGEFRVCVPCKEKKDAEYYAANRGRLMEQMRENYRKKKARFKRKLSCPET
jgi:HNH endonuclease